MNDWGRFPFGRENSIRPARTAKHSDAAIVGVYPSAWHVAWRAPPALAGEGRRGSVAALAVDVEPTVFWDGKSDDFADRLERWKKDVGFIDEKHGSISPVPPSANGSSGDKVVRQYLAPLGIDPARVTFTDVHPVFLIKTSNRPQREQGDAIRDEYDSIANELGFAPCSLPARVPREELPQIAASTFGERLVSDLATSEAPLIITLGQEVWDTMLRIPSLRAGPPTADFTALYGHAYGSIGSLTVRGTEVAWLPLVHPGLLKGPGNADREIDPTSRTVAGWGTLHARWAQAAKSGRAM